MPMPIFGCRMSHKKVTPAYLERGGLGGIFEIATTGPNPFSLPLIPTSRLGGGKGVSIDSKYNFPRF